MSGSELVAYVLLAAAVVIFYLSARRWERIAKRWEHTAGIWERLYNERDR